MIQPTFSVSVSLFFFFFYILHKQGFGWKCPRDAVKHSKNKLEEGKTTPSRDAAQKLISHPHPEFNSLKIIQALTKKKKKAAPVTAVSMKNLNILHDLWRGRSFFSRLCPIILEAMENKFLTDKKIKRGRSQNNNNTSPTCLECQSGPVSPKPRSGWIILCSVVRGETAGAH